MPSEVHGVGGAGGLQDIPQHLLPFPYHHVRRREAVLDIDAQAAPRKVLHMPHGRQDLEPFSEDLLYRLGLRRRFDDDQGLGYFPSTRNDPGVQDFLL